MVELRMLRQKLAGRAKEINGRAGDVDPDGKDHASAERARHEEAGEPVLLVGWHRAIYDIWLKELCFDANRTTAFLSKTDA